MQHSKLGCLTEKRKGLWPIVASKVPPHPITTPLVAVNDMSTSHMNPLFLRMAHWRSVEDIGTVSCSNFILPSFTTF